MKTCVCVYSNKEYSYDGEFFIFNWRIIGLNVVLVSAVQHHASVMTIYACPHEPPTPLGCH